MKIAELNLSLLNEIVIRNCLSHVQRRYAIVLRTDFVRPPCPVVKLTFRSLIRDSQSADVSVTAEDA